MKTNIFIAVALAVMVLVSGFSRAEGLSREKIPAREFYSYEKEYPLNATEKLLRETPLYKVYDVEYSGGWGSRVPAYYMVPKGDGAPFPCIVFGHGFTGNRKDIEFAYDDFAKRGYAVLSIDFWYHGDRKVPGVEMYSPNLLRMRDGLVASAIDLSRGIDFLEGRAEVDSSKIGYAGGSMGGIIGALFAGSDERVKAPVLIVGGADWSWLIGHSVVSAAVLSSNPDEIKKFAKRAKTELAPADPMYLVGNISPRPLLMINAKHDVLVPPIANAKMFRLAGEPKKLVWFDSGHEVPKEKVIPLAADWADKHVRRDDKPDFNSVVEGYETGPIKVEGAGPSLSSVPKLPLEDIFAYNKEVPLLSDTVKVETDVEGTEMFRIRYMSAHDKPVSGRLYLPIEGEGKPGCVIMIHDVGGDAGDFNYLVHLLARNGIASAVIDTMRFIDEKTASKPYGAVGLRNRITQTVVDARRLMDLLDKVADVQNGKYVVMGEGAGGMAAIIVAALDKRAGLVAAVNAGGGFDKEQLPAAMFQGGASGRAASDRERASAAMIDPALYLSEGNHVPFLAVYDDGRSAFSRGAADSMYGAAREPKQLELIENEGNAKFAGYLKGMMIFMRDHWNSSEGSGSLDKKQLPVVEGASGWKNLEKKSATTLRVVEARLSGHEAKGSENGAITVSAMLGGLANEAGKKGADTVVAYITGGTGRGAAIQLLDDGKREDRFAGDGIFTGVLGGVGEGSGNEQICVGGVGAGGESIEEKCEPLFPGGR